MPHLSAEPQARAAQAPLRPTHPSTSPPHRRYRIFPTGDDMTHTKSIKDDPVQSKSLTPLDWLMFKWIDAKWSPKHRHDKNGSVVLVNE